MYYWTDNFDNHCPSHSADREHQNDQEFRDFHRHLFHRSLEAILSSLRPAMTTPEVTLCPDGHYCRAIYGLGPYIADYPEQCLLSCIVQGWCLRYATMSLYCFFSAADFAVLIRCTASRKDLDEKNAGHLRTHEFTELLRGTYAWKVLWDNWGIVDDIMVSTTISPPTRHCQFIKCFSHLQPRFLGQIFMSCCHPICSTR